MQANSKPILLVEDEAIIALAEKSVLERCGYSVILAHNAAQAIALADATPDLGLILMDINLGPGMNGIEATAEILSRHDVPVVFLSSHREDSIVAETENVTSYGYVVKDSSPTVLIASIKMAYRLHQARQSIQAAERTVQQERDNLEAIMHASPVGMLVIDSHLHVVRANPAAERISGRTLSRLQKPRCGDFLGCVHRLQEPCVCGSTPDCDACPLYRDVRYTLTQRRSAALQEAQFFLSRREDGTFPSPACISYSTAPVTIAGETAALVTLQDITLQKQAQARLDDELKKNEQLTSLVNRSPACFFLWRNEEGWPVEYVSDNIHQLLGYEAHQFISGQVSYADVIHPEDLPRVVEEVRDYLEQGRTAYKQEYRLVDSRGEGRWVDDRTWIRQDPARNMTVIEGIILDITDRKQAEDRITALLTEKDMLLKEAHHRVMNNMGVIRSLLSVEAQTAPSSERAVDILQDAANQVQAMMTLYEELYRTNGRGDLNLRQYLPALVHNITQQFSSWRTVRTIVDIDDIVLSTRYLSPIGIMINEMVTNSMKHAFNDRQSGTIKFSALRRNGRVKLTYSDDGCGMTGSDPSQTPETFGLQLIHLLAQQINGTLEIRGSANGGTTISVSFDLADR